MHCIVDVGKIGIPSILVSEICGSIFNCFRALSTYTSAIVKYFFETPPFVISKIDGDMYPENGPELLLEQAIYYSLPQS
jgi:hypothetical protein